MRLTTKLILLLILLVLGYASWKAYEIYHRIMGPSVYLGSAESKDLIIPTDSDFDDVIQILYTEKLIQDTTFFRIVAERKNLPNFIYPGKYLIISGMSMNELINMIRSGQQEVVRLTFNNVRTKEELAGLIGAQIELDSLKILQIFRDQAIMQRFGSDTANFYARLLPNTYFVYWNLDQEEFLQLIEREHNAFWNIERKQKANAIKLSPEQVVSLAAIVEEETTKKDEMKTIAGVYINRLERGMPLQADPTIKFALQNFLKRRITRSDLQTESPYNTYMNAGLPPGPIRIPSPETVDAVLNYDKHPYLFFCAREDFSGYHHFAKTNFQHAINASKYHEALNKLKVFE
jgi:UPF0755 protein